MKTKFYFLMLMGACGILKAQTPELLYYKFEGTPTNIPNLASSPPAGTQTAEIVGNLTLGANDTCLGNALIGTSSASGTNYLNTKWTVSLPGSWSMHMKFSNYTYDTTQIFYLVGDGPSSNSFRMFTNGNPGANNIRLTSANMAEVTITNVFNTSSPVDLIVAYDSVAQNIKAYVNGVLNTTVAQPSTFTLTSGTSASNLKIGGYESGTQIGMKTGMKIDEFGLFNRAITAAEITSLNSFCPGTALSTDEVIKKEVKRIYITGDNLMLEKGNFDRYQIFDYAGRVVLSGDESSNSVNISSLKKGNYIVRFGNIVSKFKY